VSRLRLVLDTNVLVSALLFAGGRLEWLRRAWQDGAVTPLMSRETADELLRVFGYPKFRLSSQERDELLADVLPYCETVASVATDLSIACRDPEDRKFLALAVSGQADALVTGDVDLLDLAGRFEIPITTPAELRRRLSEARPKS